MLQILLHPSLGKANLMFFYYTYKQFNEKSQNGTWRFGQYICLAEIKCTERVLEKEGMLCDFYSVSIYVGYTWQPWSDCLWHVRGCKGKAIFSAVSEMGSYVWNPGLRGMMTSNWQSWTIDIYWNYQPQSLVTARKIAKFFVLGTDRNFALLQFVSCKDGFTIYSACCKKSSEK